MRSAKPKKLRAPTASSRHPFDLALDNVYKAQLRQLRLFLRVKEEGFPQAPKAKYVGAAPRLTSRPMHLPLPDVVQPPATS